MANQDYVSKPKPKKKNSKKNASKQAAVTSTTSLKNKVIIVAMLAAIAGFGYFLWVLKHQQPDTAVKTQTPAETTKKIVILPEKPKEKWSYQKELAVKEVEQGKYEVVDKGPWKMQCASFKSNAQAQELKAKIAFLGIESKVSKAQGKNGIWYKVILGPYKRKRSAERDRHKLKRNNIHHCQIWLWR